METRAAPPRSTIVGATLGNYRIVGPLARGGMGSVYRAEHAVLGRPAAVKVLRAELTTDEALVRRFLDEAKAATQIRHPGIVEVYDYGTTPDGLSYLVMELLEGAPLEERLAERGRLPAAEAVPIARAIASALKAAHRAGIVHRDLKPANVFLVPDSDAPGGHRIKILDFGIAKLVDPTRAHHTQTGALIGTPLYMAPEQARAAHAIDHRADLYSLGCILYETLVGRPPFVAEGAGEIIALHLFDAPEPPSRRAEVAPALEAVVLRLLAKEPAERYADAQAVIDAIDAVDAVDAIDAIGGPRVLGAPAVLGVRDAAAAAATAGAPAPLAPGSRTAGVFEELAPPPPERRSALSFAAGAITMGIAVAVGLFVFARGSSSEGDRGDGSGERRGDAPESPDSLAAPDAPAAPAPALPGARPAASAPAPARGPSEPAAPVRPADTRESRPPRAPAPPSRAAGTPDAPPRPAVRKSDSASGPVTHPDGPVTRPEAGGPVTRPGGPRTPEGSPYNTADALDRPAAPPAPPAPPPPAPPPSAPAPDRLPDKPAPTEGSP